MKSNIKMQAVVAACIVALTVGTGMLSRAESATAQENLEKLKTTNSCRGCDLSGLTINRTNLAGADLEGADLSRTKFFLSNLSGANLRNANLKGAYFGGTDLGAADLRGADLRGTSLEGAYLEGSLLDGEFVTAKPYEDLGVADVEKQVYVPDPEKPKKSPETRDVKVAARPDVEKSPSSDKKKITADKVKMTADGQQPGAPAAKKAIPVGQAIVEPQEQAGEQIVAEPGGVVEAAAKALSNGADTGKSSSTRESMPKKMAEARKPPPVPPAEVKIDEVQAKAPGKSGDGVEEESGLNPAEKSKRDRLARLLKEDKCLGCDLSGLDLSGKNLKNVDLERANLSGCNLERVIFDKANLKGAILHNAVLRMASLKNADLYKADLSGADLSGANVQGAKLDNAKLSSVVGLQAASE